jgi:hypothetical protein
VAAVDRCRCNRASSTSFNLYATTPLRENLRDEQLSSRCRCLYYACDTPDRGASRLDHVVAYASVGTTSDPYA